MDQSASLDLSFGNVPRLALTSGVLGFFIVCSPLFEFVIPKKPGLNMTGLTLINLLALGGLIWLVRRTAHWEVMNTHQVSAEAKLRSASTDGTK